MAGIVDYSGDEDDEEPTRKRRKLPPPLPSLVASVSLDDPSKHQGRIRTKPHVDGQFAALVLVPLQLHASLQCLLSKILLDVQKKIPEMQPFVHSELHVSLSRTLYLREHQRDDLIKAAKAAADQITSFDASCIGFNMMHNDERTRTFLTMEIGAGHVELHALVNALHPTLSRLRQENYYSEPHFHASIGWTLLTVDSPDQEEGCQNASWSQELVTFLEHEYGNTIRERMVFTVDEVRVVIGKRESACKLKSKRLQ